MPKSRIAGIAGEAATRSVLGGASDRETMAVAVRYLLQVLADTSPGNTVEVRVPPFGAAQVIEGPVHTRGTPPNVVETDPRTWVALATGEKSWSEALGDGTVSASGSRSDLSGRLPVQWHSNEAVRARK